MRWFDRLQTRLNAIFLMLAVIPLIIISGTIGLRSYGHLRQDALDYLQSRTTLFALEIDGFLIEKTDILLYAAQVGDLSEPSRIANSLISFNATLNQVAVLDDTGMEIALASRTSATPDLNSRAGQAEYVAITSGQAIYYSDVWFDEILREPLMTIAVPVADRQTGALAGVLVADFRFRAIWELLADSDFRPGEQIYVIDESGQVVAHRNPSVVLRGMTVDANTESNQPAAGLMGENVLINTEQIQYGNQTFTLVAEQNIGEALVLARDILWITGIVLVLSLITVGGLTVFVVRYVVRPIRDLSEAAGQIAVGDLSRQVSVQGHDEFAALGRAFNAMANQLNRLISDLREAEERYRTVSDFSTDWTYWENADGTLQYVSPSCENIIGYAPAAIIENPAIINECILDADTQIWRDHQHVPRSDDTPSRIQFRMRHLDGTVRWIEHVCVPVLDSEERFQGYRVSNRDITETIESQAIALENERLRARFNQEKSQNTLIQRIISALSHDMKTPLSVISTSKDLLIRYADRMDAAKRREKLDTIGRQIHFVLEMLDDTVAIARGELDNATVNLVPVHLSTLCQVSADEIAEAGGTPRKIVFVDRSDFDVALLDEVLVSRILLNLLSNAMKYSPEHTPIQLELERVDDMAVLRVIDQGVGIDAQDLRHIFEPFYRVEDVKHIEGTGLGLSIVKNCIDRLDGDITVSSTVGQGTEFTVSLPLIVPDTAPTSFSPDVAE